MKPSGPTICLCTRVANPSSETATRESCFRVAAFGVILTRITGTPCSANCNRIFNIAQNISSTWLYNCYVFTMLLIGYCCRFII